MTDKKDENQVPANSPESLQGQEESASLSGPALIEKFVIRLPKGLRNKIKHLSEQNRRSMNSEIIMVLEKHIQNNLSDSEQDIVREFAANLTETAGGQPAQTDNSVPSDSELARRLEDLPEEKKLALLELLG